MTITGQGNIIILPTYKIDASEHLTQIWAILPDTHILVVMTTALTMWTSCRSRLNNLNNYLCYPNRKKGLGPAYIAGFHWALKRDYQSIFEMDADLPSTTTSPSIFTCFGGPRYRFGMSLHAGGGVELGSTSTVVGRFGNFYPNDC